MPLVTDTKSEGGAKTLSMLPRKTRSQTLAEVLAKGDLMRPLNGGGILEGLTRGGEAYLRTRGAREADTKEEQRAQALANALAGGIGNREELFRRVAAVDPASALGILPKEQGPMEVSPGASLAQQGADGAYGTLYTAPKPQDLPEGMIQGPDGQPVWAPGYLGGKSQIARAGVPPMPAPPSGFVPDQ